jgi:bacterioferritin (cytochrome b1)
MPGLDNEKIVALLNRILESELAGVVRYTHYSFLVFGFGRIPISSPGCVAKRTRRCYTPSKRAR